jgi:hypothetical protein
VSSEIPEGDVTHVIKSFAIFPNPLEVQLGEGKILCSIFKDADGSSGIRFAYRDDVHEIGESGGADEITEPKEGEVYVRCANLASARVLRDLANEVVQHFERL